MAEAFVDGDVIVIDSDEEENGAEAEPMGVEPAQGPDEGLPNAVLRAVFGDSDDEEEAAEPMDPEPAAPLPFVPLVPAAPPAVPGSLLCQLSADQTAADCPAGGGFTNDNVIKFSCTEQYVRDANGGLARRNAGAKCFKAEDILGAYSTVDEWFENTQAQRPDGLPRAPDEKEMRDIFNIWMQKRGEGVPYRNWTKKYIEMAINLHAEAEGQLVEYGNANLRRGVFTHPANNADAISTAFQTRDRNTDLPISTVLSGGDQAFMTLFARSGREEMYARMTTNSDEIAAYLAARIDEIVDCIPATLGGMTLLPMQCLAVYNATHVYGIDRTATIRIHNTSQTQTPLDDVFMSAKLPAGKAPTVSIISYGTGVGKTVMSLVCGLRSIMDEAAYRPVRAGAAGRITSLQGNNFTGITFERAGQADPVYARLLIVSAPDKVMSAWEASFDKIIDELKAHYNVPRVIVKKSLRQNGRNVDMTVSIRSIAAEVDENRNQIPTVWFVPYNNASITHALGSTPNAHYTSMIIDESNATMKFKDVPTSECYGTTFIAQATPQSIIINNSDTNVFKKAIYTSYMPSIAMIGEKIRYVFDQRVRDRPIIDLAKRQREIKDEMMSLLTIRLSCPTMFMRLGMSRQTEPLLPRTIRFIPVRYTMNNFLNQNANPVAPTTLDTYISGLVGRMPPAFRQEIIDRVVHDITNAQIGALPDFLRERANQYVEQNPRLQEDVRSSLRRLAERIQAMTEANLECLVCFNDVDAGTMRIGRCCTAAYCDGCFPRLDICANCRGALGAPVQVGVAPQAPQPGVMNIDDRDPIEQVAADLRNAERVRPLEAFKKCVLSLTNGASSRVLVYYNKPSTDFFFDEARAVLNAKYRDANGAANINVYHMKITSRATVATNRMLLDFNKPGPGRVVVFIEKPTGEYVTASAQNMFGLDFKEATGLMIDDPNVPEDLRTQLIGRVTRLRKRDPRNPQDDAFPIVFMCPRLAQN